jgi:HD-GYP domain-containing protein (c-di-GMP phosphodiesterase class II)
MLLAEQLVGEARERRKQRMDLRERLFDASSALLFLTAAAAVALMLDSGREFDPVLAVALTLGYALAMRVAFEFADAFVSTEELIFVPMLVLLPPEYVPLLVATASIIGTLPDLQSGVWHRERWVSSVSACWFALGPAVIIGLLASGDPSLAHAEVYALAFVAQIGGELVVGLPRDLLLHVSVRETVRSALGTARVDAVLAMIAFSVAYLAVGEPIVLAMVGPVVWLLAKFARDRRQRYSATLELNRAYKGTVMLLADVVEADDKYTAAHSHSVVDLVLAAADELKVDDSARQELEFAALLHDVGKIVIPKEILNKPASLTREEFELMKTHTIEGQFMLDRVGGLLGRVGEIVRSCHERWDGAGYPDGLKGEEIPLAARIVFVCDAWNAMTTNRPYRQALSPEAARAELIANAGTQFDPAVVTAVTQVVEQGEPSVAAARDVRALLAGVRVGEPVRAA